MTTYNFEFWKTFYKIRYYPFITEEQTLNEIKFIKDFLPIKKYINILDFICGFGRHSIELTKNNYHVEGFDMDRGSILNAKKVIRILKLKNIHFYTKDAFKFKKGDFFDAVICLYSSMGFLDERSNEVIFKNLFQSVKKGGRIILDVMNPEWAIKYLKSYSEKEIIYKGKSYFVKHQRTILHNPIIEKNAIEFLDQKRFLKYKSFYTLRLYFLKELENKFLENNFKIYKTFGSFNKDVVSENYQRIIFIADKI